MNADHRGCLLLAAGLVLAGCSHARPPVTAPTAAPPAPVAAPAPAPAAVAPPAAAPRLRPDPAACAASVAEAQRDGRHPERLSPQIRPAPYVAPADDAALQRYLDTIEPGRVFQTADPARGGPQLAVVGSGATPVIPLLGSTDLAVRTVPGAPCTFLAQEGGGFDESGLSCATVLADAEGIARVRYRADDGTLDDCSIQVGSPAAVGTLTLLVHIHHPGSFLPPPATPLAQP